MSRKKIGLLGGTFDPVHNGHLITAQFILEKMHLDEIWFLPSAYHIFKDPSAVSAVSHRLNMLNLAIRDHPYFRIETLEIEKNTISRTYDTLNELQAKYPEMIFFFLVGIDAVNQFDRWYRIHDLLNRFTVITFGRPPFQLNETGKTFINLCEPVHTPLIEISSTEIRQRVAEGKLIRYYVPESVEKYILEQGLYRKNN